MLYTLTLINNYSSLNNRDICSLFFRLFASLGFRFHALFLYLKNRYFDLTFLFWRLFLDYIFRCSYSFFFRLFDSRLLRIDVLMWYRQSFGLMMSKEDCEGFAFLLFFYGSFPSSVIILISRFYIYPCSYILIFFQIGWFFVFYSIYSYWKRLLRIVLLYQRRLFNVLHNWNLDINVLQSSIARMRSWECRTVKSIRTQ